MRFVVKPQSVTQKKGGGGVQPVSELGFAIYVFTADALFFDALTIIPICGSHIIRNDILRHTSHRLAKQARYISSYRSDCLLHFSPKLRMQVYVTSLRPSYVTLYITSVGLFYRTCVSPTLHNQSTFLLRYDIYNTLRLHNATIYTTTLRLSTTIRYIQTLYVSLLRYGIYKHFTSLYYATVYTTTLRLSTTLRYIQPLYVSLLRYGIYNHFTSLYYATVYTTTLRLSTTLRYTQPLYVSIQTFSF